MKRLGLGFLVVVAALGTAGSIAADSCVESNRSEGQNVGYDAIRLAPHGIPQSLTDEFGDAYGSWNQPTCNTGFPRFQEHIGGAGRTIDVYYSEGFNPSNRTSCGNFSGNTINLYEKAETADGAQTVFCSDPRIFQDTVAHELGHTLGLRDQYGGGCNGYIMAQTAVTRAGNYIDRSIKGSECSMVASTNVTPREQMIEECDEQPEECPQCDPQEVGCGSPIVLDLGGNGFRFTGLEDAVLFDIDADRFSERSGWTERAVDDVFLALDRDGNGRIEDGSELFGNATRFLDGSLAQNGYQILFELDVVAGNGNGWIDPGDEAYADLVLWHDGNGNAASDPGELLPLAEAGVVGLLVDHSFSAETDEHGNYLQFRSTALLQNAGGQLRSVDTVDVFFLVEDRSTEASPTVSLTGAKRGRGH